MFCSKCGISLESATIMEKNGSSRWLKIAVIAGAVVLIAIIVALLTGLIGEPSPVDVAIAFYMAGNEGDYTKAYDYLYPGVWEAGIGLFLKFDSAMDAATKGGTITRIEAKDPVQMGPNTVIVVLTLNYKDGSQEQDHLTLMRTDGRWEIFDSTLLRDPRLLYPIPHFPIPHFPIPHFPHP